MKKNLYVYIPYNFVPQFCKVDTVSTNHATLTVHVILDEKENMCAYKSNTSTVGFCYHQLAVV